MRKWAQALAAGAGALLAAVSQAAPPEDGKAAFERREDKMKHMGRPFYLGIGRVVKGTAAYGPDTVTAAETVAALASTLADMRYWAMALGTGGHGTTGMCGIEQRGARAAGD